MKCCIRNTQKYNRFNSTAKNKFNTEKKDNQTHFLQRSALLNRKPGKADDKDNKITPQRRIRLINIARDWTMKAGCCQTLSVRNKTLDFNYIANVRSKIRILMSNSLREMSISSCKYQQECFSEAIHTNYTYIHRGKSVVKKLDSDHSFDFFYFPLLAKISNKKC